MTDKVKKIFTLYGILLEDHMERLERAALLGKSGVYDAEDLAHDWSETASDIYRAWRRTWELAIPDPENAVMRVREGKEKAFCQVRVDDELKDVDQEAQLVGSGKAIDFKASVDASNAHRVNIEIKKGSGLEAIPSGAILTAKVYDKSTGARGKKLFTIMLQIRDS